MTFNFPRAGLVLLLLSLAGCGGLDHAVRAIAPAPPVSTGIVVPASVVVEDGQRGAVRLRLASVVGDGGFAAGRGSRGFSAGASGRKHDGIDILAPTGTPVRAAAGGMIVDLGWRGAYGRFILIRHSALIETAYAHLSRFEGRLAVGRSVQQGDVIGYVGTSGNATGPHLHYEVRSNGIAIDPMASPTLTADIRP